MLASIAVAGLIACAVTLGVLSSALRALEERARPNAPLPPITVIRPVRGLDPGLEHNVRAALRQRYPARIETIFVLDDPDDDALPVIEREIARERADARIVLAGRPPPGRTGKLHAMIAGLAAARARTTLVAFADSDTRPDPGVLEDLAASVAASHDVGAAFARAIGTEPAQTLGDVGYGLLLDGIYGPQAAVATRWRGSLPFVMGQTMVLRRSALDACGGLEGSDGELVDDMHIGLRLAGAGYRNVVSGTPVAIVQHGSSFQELRSTALRWMVFGRTGIPSWPFNVPAAVWIVTYLLGVIGAVIALAPCERAALVLCAASAASVVVALEMLRRQQGGAPLPARLWWAPFVCLALVPWWFVRARFTKRIVWRGRTYALDSAGRLGARPGRPPPPPSGPVPLRPRSAW